MRETIGFRPTEEDERVIRATRRDDEHTGAPSRRPADRVDTPGDALQDRAAATALQGAAGGATGGGHT